MPRTLTITDIDDDTYEAIKRLANDEGRSVPEYLRRLIVQAASRPSLAEWMKRTRGRSSDVTREEILAHLDASRGAAS